MLNRLVGHFLLSIREQWNKSASQICEMTYRSWNSLSRMKCTAVHWGFILFHDMRSISFQDGLPVISSSALPSISFFTHSFRHTVLAIAKTSPIPCVNIFKEYKAKSLWSIEHDNQTTRVCKLACKRASETKLRAFCEKQNRVRSTTSVDVKLASSICFEQKGRFNL